MTWSKSGGTDRWPRVPRRKALQISRHIGLELTRYRGRVSAWDSSKEGLTTAEREELGRSSW